MNDVWINHWECNVKQANNLALDWSPIVNQCYKTTDPFSYQNDPNQYLFYKNIRRGDIVYENAMFENPYFSPLFTSSNPELYLETSPQLVSRITSKNNTIPSLVGNNVQLDDEIFFRDDIFKNLFDQVNKNTFASNRLSPHCAY